MSSDYSDAVVNSGTVGIQGLNLEFHGPVHVGQNDENVLEKLGRLLPIAKEAAFNSYGKRHDALCSHDTRVEVLQSIISWAIGENGSPIFWLNGMAGTGKSTIARTVARSLSNAKVLGATFFFSRGGGDLSNAQKVLTTICWHLVNTLPRLRDHVYKILNENRALVSQGLREQWEQLIITPLSMLDDFSCPILVIIIDALDECENDNDIRLLLRLFTETEKLHGIQLRVFVTSRPEMSIRLGFRKMSEILHYDLVLDLISRDLVDHDIECFLKKSFDSLKEDSDHIPKSWPGEQQIAMLVQKAGGLFIYAATVIRFISSYSSQPPQQLLEALVPSVQGKLSQLSTHDTSNGLPTAELDEMYLQILKHSVKAKDDPSREQLVRELKKIIEPIVILAEPLSPAALARLLSIDLEIVYFKTDHLRSVLRISNDRETPIRLLHPSFRDYLLDESRCSEHSFLVDQRLVHRELGRSCLERLNRRGVGLKQDICGLEKPGIQVNEIDPSAIAENIPTDLAYACQYMVHHLQQGEEELDDDGPVHVFLLKHLLHWFEALSLLGRVSEGVRTIQSLQNRAKGYQCPNLQAFLHDAMRFILFNRFIIEQAPLQIYTSALIFAPTKSLVKTQFRNLVPRWITKVSGIDENWGKVMQTLEGHKRTIYALEMSPNGKLLASGSRDGTIKIWDPFTGSIIHTLKYPGSTVQSLSFSLDGKRLVSASDDVIQIWDSATGVALERHMLNTINPKVKFMQHGILISSNLEYPGIGIFHIWDPDQGNTLQKLPLPDDINEFGPTSITSSGQLSAWISRDYNAVVCDNYTGEIVHQISSPDLDPFCSALSPDGTLFATLSIRNTITIVKIATRVTLQKLNAEKEVHRLLFSSDGKLLGAATKDGVVVIYDTYTGSSILKYLSHTARLFLNFSPDNGLLVLSANSGNIELLDISKKDSDQKAPKRPWNRMSGILASTMQYAGLLSIFHAPDTYSHIKNPTTFEVKSLCFSPDGKLLGTLEANDQAAMLLDQDTDAVDFRFSSHMDDYYMSTLSLDGRLLAICKSFKLTEIWNLASGALIQSFEDETAPPKGIALSPTGGTLAILRKKNITLWNLKTGVNTLNILNFADFDNGYYGSLGVAFSPDGLLLAAASYRGISIWDSTEGEKKGSTQGDSQLGHPPSMLVFSTNGELLASKSESHIRIWDVDTCSLVHRFLISGFPFLENPSVSLWSFLSSRQLTCIFQHIQDLPWVARGAEKLLWLPPGYRGRWAAHEDSVALALASGKIVCIKFDKTFLEGGSDGRNELHLDF